MSLELGKPEGALLREAYLWYIRDVIPRIGKVLLGDKTPYDHLSQSIMAFPFQGKFLAILKDLGFEKAGYREFIKGAAVVHYGTKPM